MQCCARRWNSRYWQLMSAEKELISKCLQLIEKKLGWGPVSEWHNEMFEELSQLIENETKVLLSSTTLKRVFGRVKYKNDPSISTLNTLAQFLELKNWREFKENNQVKLNQKTKKTWPRQHAIIITSAAALTLVFISLFSLTRVGESGPTVEELSAIQFSSQPVTTGMPNSVVFEFDLAGIESEDIKIQQYWDESKTIEIKPGQTQATGIYWRPGYFRSKLLIDGQIVREHDLYIKSDGWLGTIGYEPVSKYLYEPDIMNEGLCLNEQALDEIRQRDEPITSTFHYVEEFPGLSGDNFQIDATISNVYNEKWAVCQYTAIYILGSKSAIIIPFAIKGCASDISVMLSENFMSGKENDHSMLGTDFNEPRDISISVVNQNVTVAIDQEQVYENQYTKVLGDFAGIRVVFEGAGRVHQFHIRNLEGVSYPVLDSELP